MITYHQQRATGAQEKRTGVLAFIQVYIVDHGYPPSMRDIQRGCGLSSISIVAHALKRLEAAGMITREPRISRGINLTGVARIEKEDPE